MKKFLRGLAFILAVLILSSALTIGFGPLLLNDNAENIDYVIVLGAKTDGKEPTKELEGRLIAGLDCLKKNPQAKIIVTGGLSKAPTKDDMDKWQKGNLPKGTRIDRNGNIEYPSAQVMKDYLVMHGINEDRILVEEQSTSTYENLLYSKNLIARDENPYPRNLIVTSRYHLYRASLLADRLNIKASYLPSDNKFLDFREIFAFMKSFAFDR